MATKLSDYRPFYYDIIPAPVVIDSSVTLVPIQTLSVPNAPAGIYLLTVSFTFSTPDINDFVQFAYDSDDGTITETVFRKEAKDADDIIGFSYSFPRNHSGGTLSMKLGGLLESGGQDCTIRASNMVFEKKG